MLRDRLVCRIIHVHKLSQDVLSIPGYQVRMDPGIPSKDFLGSSPVHLGTQSTKYPGMVPSVCRYPRSQSTKYMYPRIPRVSRNGPGILSILGYPGCTGMVLHAGRVTQIPEYYISRDTQGVPEWSRNTKYPGIPRMSQDGPAC